MAQGLLQKYLEDNNLKHIDVKTAGVMTIAGLLPTQEAVQVMDTVDVDIRRHRSAPLTPELLRKADIILGMTPFHVQFALRMDDAARDKTFLLKEYTKSDLKNYQITDPMGATLEVYKRVFREIKLAVEKLGEMDTIHAPVDELVKHEKWTPKKKKKKPETEPEAEKKAETGAKKKSSKSSKSKSAKTAKTSAKKSSAKKSSAKKASTSGSANKKSTTKKTTAKKSK